MSNIRKKYSKMLLVVLVLNVCYAWAEKVVYDSYTAAPVNDTQLKTYEAAGITGSCTVAVETCNETEWRRLDGTCNNLEYVSVGSLHTPQMRFVEARFNTENGFEPRLTKSGKPLKPARYLREQILPVGFSLDEVFVQSTAYYLEFLFADIGTSHDTRNFVVRNTHCCAEAGKSDYMCTPINISDTDHVHQFSSIRCMNLTRPMSYQNVGCTRNDTVPDRIDFTTPYWDLSSIYYYLDGVDSKYRANSSGLMKTEIADGTEFPSSANETTTCTIQQAIKTECTREVPNGLPGLSYFTMMYWRHHNFIARQLAELNPCWDNDMLFYNAREINIGFYNQILYYEIMPLLIGEETMINEGVISSDTSCRTTYDSTIPPRMSVEMPYALRWFHTVQNGMQKMIDKDGLLVTEMPATNFSSRVQYFGVDNNFAHITYGMLKQPSARFDNMVDPQMTEKALGRLQKAFDVTAADLLKGRYFGIAPYIEYREFCTNQTITCFDDLKDVMSEENINIMKEKYDDVSDLELMAGMWSEKMMDGGHIAPTLACILIHQLKRSISYDRHWYESCDRPHAFTEEQLQEIRKATLARLYCNAADNITAIQPNAFLVIDDCNSEVSCDEIPTVDLSAWIDSSCSSSDTCEDYESDES